MTTTTETDAPAPQPLQVAAHVKESRHIRDRIATYVETLRWQNPDADPTAPVPVDALAAAVAADPQVAEWIIAAMESADEQIRHDVGRACTNLPDSEIVRVVGPALKRLED